MRGVTTVGHPADRIDGVDEDCAGEGQKDARLGVQERDRALEAVAHDRDIVGRRPERLVWLFKLVERALV